ncbi:hypothetical protein [uncultured Oscillibacter sp.]|uniref:hypothetical protein n=1 Tax=uncultured Oscillibacter sp. TaxID=876091 RepID=UPI0025FD6578|nr:hypothetical protein [uncultured Oscillibacter sp.]
MKKLISILFAFVMVFFNLVPAMAVDHQHEHMVPDMAAEDTRERITLEVDSIEDVREFYNSPEHDENKVYSFIIKYNPMMLRAACPNCGKGAWTGGNYGIDELAPYFQDCPQQGGMSSDKAVVMFYHYREWCRNCGYEIVHDQYFFRISCQYMPDFAGYEAWDGQRVEDGYDRHEDKSFWYAVPAKYH